MPKKRSFAQKLDQLIVKKKVSHRDISRETGIDIGSISQYRNGKTMPGGNKILALEKFFKCKAGFLLTDG